MMINEIQFTHFFYVSYHQFRQIPEFHVIFRRVLCVFFFGRVITNTYTNIYRNISYRIEINKYHNKNYLLKNLFEKFYFHLKSNFKFKLLSC